MNLYVIRFKTEAGGEIFRQPILAESEADAQAHWEEIKPQDAQQVSCWTSYQNVSIAGQ